MDEVKEQAAKIEQRIYDDAVWVNGLEAAVLLGRATGPG